MTRQNTRHVLAPSIRAASSDLLGERLETGDHDDEREARGTARPGCRRRPRSPTPATVRSPAAVLIPSHCIRPLDGLRIVSKMTAATAIEVIAVDEKITWKTAHAAELLVREHREGETRGAVPIGTAIATKIAVARSESRNVARRDHARELVVARRRGSGTPGYGGVRCAAMSKFSMNGKNVKTPKTRSAGASKSVAEARLSRPARPRASRRAAHGPHRSAPDVGSKRCSERRLVRSPRGGPARRARVVARRRTGGPRTARRTSSVQSTRTSAPSTSTNVGDRRDPVGRRARAPRVARRRSPGRRAAVRRAIATSPTRTRRRR